jgi:lipopolysaccharide export system protein LptC
VLTAQTMTHYPVEDSSRLEQVVLTTTTPGQPKLVARSPVGRLISGGDEVVMEGGVVVDSAAFGSSPSMRLSTPRLTVLPEKNTATSREGVLVESSQGVMNASGFELNNKTKTLRMENMRATLVSGN